MNNRESRNISSVYKTPEYQSGMMSEAGSFHLHTQGPKENVDKIQSIIDNAWSQFKIHGKISNIGGSVNKIPESAGSSTELHRIHGQSHTPEQKTAFYSSQKIDSVQQLSEVLPDIMSNIIDIRKLLIELEYVNGVIPGDKPLLDVADISDDLYKKCSIDQLNETTYEIHQVINIPKEGKNLDPDSLIDQINEDSVNKNLPESDWLHREVAGKDVIAIRSHSLINQKKMDQLADRQYEKEIGEIITPSGTFERKILVETVLGIKKT